MKLLTIKTDKQKIAIMPFFINSMEPITRTSTKIHFVNGSARIVEVEYEKLKDRWQKLMDWS